MTLSVFLAVSAAVQVLFLGLDLGDRHATRAERYGGEPLHRASADAYLADRKPAAMPSIAPTTAPPVMNTAYAIPSSE